MVKLSTITETYYKGELLCPFRKPKFCFWALLEQVYMLKCILFTMSQMFKVSMKPLLLKSTLRSDWSAGSVCCDLSTHRACLGNVPPLTITASFMHSNNVYFALPSNTAVVSETRRVWWREDVVFCYQST